MTFDFCDALDKETDTDILCQECLFCTNVCMPFYYYQGYVQNNVSRNICHNLHVTYNNLSNNAFHRHNT
jgi:hypothetical protein